MSKRILNNQFKSQTVACSPKEAMSPIQNKDFKTLKTIQFEELQEQTESNQTIQKKPV